MIDGSPMPFAPPARRHGPRRPRVKQPLRLAPDLTEALAGGKLRLLAVDQGSMDLGLAFLEGERVVWTKRLSPTGTWSWQRRMRWITDEMRELLAQGAPPEVLAIEDVAFGVNASTAITMGKALGWLMCALEYWYPGVRSLAVHPGTVRAAVGAPRSRAGAKDQIRRAVEALTGLKGLSEDECDAVVIGLAARSTMQRAALLARAGA